MSNTIHGLIYVEIKADQYDPNASQIVIYSQSSAINTQRQAGINFPYEQDLGGYQGENSNTGYNYELTEYSTGTVIPTESSSMYPYTYDSIGDAATGTADASTGDHIDMIRHRYQNLTPGQTYQLKSTNYQGDVKTWLFYTPEISDWGNYGNANPNTAGTHQTNKVVYTFNPRDCKLEVELRFEKTASYNDNVSEALRTDLTFTDASGVGSPKTILNPATDGNVTSNYDFWLSYHNPNTYNATSIGAPSTQASNAIYAELKNGCSNYNGDCFSNAATIDPTALAWNNTPFISNSYPTHVVDLTGTPDAGDWGYNIPDGQGGSSRIKIYWPDISCDDFRDSSTLGCTDASAFNYNPNATIDDGSCCFVAGCTDPSSSNYDPNACYDDGSCVTLTPAVTCNSIRNHMQLQAQSWGVSSSGATDGSVLIRMIYNQVTWNLNCTNCNCTALDFAKDFRFDIQIQQWDTGTNSALSGGYYHSETNVAITDAQTQTLTTFNNGINAVLPEPAVMNLPEGDFKITITCVSDTGEGSPQNCNSITYYPDGTTTPWHGQFLGCQEEAMINVGVNTFSPVYGCTDSYAINYNTNANIDDGSCIYNVVGCTNPLSPNYDPLATVDDGSCIQPILGCTDPTAVNFNPLATVDNGSCIACVYGCTNQASSNYNPNATCDDGSCTGCVYGCTDSTASNYDANATCDDGSCCVDGCTDPNALNYNVLATCDDGSCQFCVDGCTDPSAANYNSSATCDDGSCIESECSDCYKLLNTLYKEANCEGCKEEDYMQEKRNLQRFTNLRIMRDMAYECGDTNYISSMQSEEFEMCSTLLDEHTNEGTNDDYKVYGCTNPNSINYNPKATHPCEKNGVFNYCCQQNTQSLMISGCIDPLATNYNPDANIDDGTCTY